MNWELQSDASFHPSGTHWPTSWAHTTAYEILPYVPLLLHVLPFPPTQLSVQEGGVGVHKRPSAASGSLALLTLWASGSVVFLLFSLEKLACLFSSLPVFAPNKFLLSLGFDGLPFIQSPFVFILQ